MNKNEKKHLKIVLLLGTIAISGISILCTILSSPNSTKVRLDPFAALGLGMAEETIRMLGESGGNIILIVEDTQGVKAPALEIQIKSFLETLNKSKVVVLKTEFVTPEIEMRNGILKGVSESDYSEITKKYPHAKAFVSFSGPPQLPQAQMEMHGESPAKWIIQAEVMENDLDEHFRNLFDANILHAAIVTGLSRLEQEQKNPETLRDWFDNCYQVITKSNASNILP